MDELRDSTNLHWYECRDKEELESLGSWLDVKNHIQRDTSLYENIAVGDWHALFNEVNEFKKKLCKKHDIDSDLFFISEEHETIFYLVKLDGKERQKALGITGLHYKNKEVAKKWYKKMIMLLHPDRCNHPQAKAAWKEMEKLHSEMLT